MEAQAKQGMLCPVCKVGLVMSDRQGIEIDYCPQCRGVWLDRGELDKIIDRSTGAEAPPPRLAPDYRMPERAVDRGYANADMRPDDNRRGWRGRDDDDDDDDARRGGRRRRGGWLGDLFEFGD